MLTFNLTGKSGRTLFFLTTISCSSLLAFGYYLQFVEDLNPCPLCIFQRVCYIAIVAVSMAAGIHGSAKFRDFYALSIAILAAVGGVIAGRQVWLQHLPPTLRPECGPGLDYMLRMYPFTDVITKTLQGTGDCATV